MKIILSIISLILLFFSCNSHQKEKSKQVVLENKQTNTLVITIPGVTDEEFRIVEKGDSVIYSKQSYEGLGGKKIVLDTTQTKSIEARCRFTLGFLQYLTDDRVAGPLNFFQETAWLDLKVTNGEIIIPDFYGNIAAQTIHQLIGFKSESEMDQWFEKQQLSAIKTESLKVQTEYYSNLLANKQAYKYCCPEYIRQAEVFLASDKAKLNTLQELALELYYKELTVDIQAELENGKVIHKVIVEREE